MITPFSQSHPSDIPCICGCRCWQSGGSSRGECDYRVRRQLTFTSRPRSDSVCLFVLITALTGCNKHSLRHLIFAPFNLIASSFLRLFVARTHRAWIDAASNLVVPSYGVAPITVLVLRFLLKDGTSSLDYNMPPYGLYPIPRHHLSAQSPPKVRPVFNSMDFQDEVSEPATMSAGGSSTGDKKVKKEKTSKRQLTDADAGKSAVKVKKTPKTPTIGIKLESTSSKGKKSTDKKEKGTSERGTSGKKRKRESATVLDLNSPNTPRYRPPFNDRSVLGGSFIDSLKATMGDISSSFNTLPPPTAIEKPKKKKSKLDLTSDKTRRKSKEIKVTGTSIPPSVEKPSKTKKAKSYGDLKIAVTSSPTKTPVPLPEPRTPQKPALKQTPVPLPQQSPYRRLRAATEPPQQHGKSHSEDAAPRGPRAQESQIPRTPATGSNAIVPLSSTRRTTASEKAKHKVNDYRQSLLTAFKDVQIPVSAPSQTSLTTSNPTHYKQALSDVAKPRPRGRGRGRPRNRSRSRSRALSVTSNGSGKSILDAFARGGGPQGEAFSTLVGTPGSPSPVKSRKQRRSSKKHTSVPHQPHPSTPTNQKSLYTVLLHHRTTLPHSSQLPCLSRPHGCTPSLEHILRLSHTSPSPLLRIHVSSPTDTARLHRATQRTQTAETFLRHAFAAGVGVPVGEVRGRWKVFCPGYAGAHGDVWGFGRRTLRIKTVAGGYEVGLRLPPREEDISIGGIEAPVWAGFGRVRMGGEGVGKEGGGVEMEIVFLGNGYMLVYMELGMLVNGERGDGHEDGKGVMVEVLGVHEKAVVWDHDDEEEIAENEGEDLE